MWFLHFFQGYTFQSVMDENAYIFFTLLEESYRVSAEMNLMNVAVNAVPHMKEDDSKEFLDSLQKQTNDILDLMDTSNVTPKEEIRKIING